jgi:hypothetical protein
MASIVISKASFVHMPLLVVEGIQFNCDVDLLLCGSRANNKFSLFVIYKSNMLLHHLHGIVKFMIIILFIVPTSK